MCEFCKIDKTDRDYMCGEFLDESSFDLGIFPDLRVQTNITGKSNDRKILIYAHIYQKDECAFDLPDYPVTFIKIPIKYCPKCGRKLN